MFIKVYYVFKESAYRLSQCTLRLFIILFMVLPIPLSFMSATLYEFGAKYRLVIYGIIGLFSLIFTYLFVYKLYQIYRDSRKHQSDDKENKTDPANQFLSTLTKTTILAFTSVSFTMLVPLVSWNDNMTETFLMILVDVYTNFICVMLTYSIFDSQYQKCCGCCDKNFKKCLFKIESGTDIINQMKTIISSSDTSNTDMKIVVDVDAEEQQTNAV